MNNIKIVETLFSDPTYKTPNNLVEFREWIDILLVQIPEECRKSASILFDYDELDRNASVEIFYQRPETKVERKERLMLINKRKETAKKVKSDRYELFLKLKKEFNE